MMKKLVTALSKKFNITLAVNLTQPFYFDGIYLL